ncbi:hypothetical protein AALO_G00300460 [Alosa alosa]|uniref:Ig-like domain-containing protein n=1 Tax=Alosa alosa TaxID=278164 RepID=A0AAV6FHI8_9TELE|nr:hypothetical protein AALO_G00300460 [Alosa alosa]
MKLILAVFLGFLCCSFYTAENLKAVVTMDPNLMPIFRGEYFSLRCDIQGESNHGRWWYRWYRDDSLFRNNAEMDEIAFKPINDSFNNSFLKCMALHVENQLPQIESEPYKMVVLDIPTPTITIQPPQQLHSADRVTLSCDITQGGGWKYLWERNNKHIHHLINRTITISLPEESGRYECSGVRRGLRSYSSPDMTVSMNALPEAKLTAEPQSPLSTGGMVTLKCVIESHSNWTYKWYKDKKNNLVIEGNNFTITRATDSDEGTYWCQGVRRERPTSSQLSNSLPVGKRDSGSSLLITGVAVARGVAGGVVLTIIILKVVPRCCRRQTGAVSNTSSAGPGLAGRNTTDEYDGEGRHIYETTEFTEPSRPVMDTVYDKLSLSKMAGMLEDPSDAGLCTLGGNASPLSSPYSLAE